MGTGQTWQIPLQPTTKNRGFYRMKIQIEESNREYFSYQPVKEFTTKSGKKKHYQFKEQFSINGNYMGILIATKPELIRFDFNLVELKKRRKKQKWIK